MSDHPKKSWQAMGLEAHELFTDRAAPYWAQFTHEEFLEQVRTEILTGLQQMMGYVQWLADDTSIRVLHVHRGEFKMSVQEVLDHMMNGEDRVHTTIDFALDYLQRPDAHRKPSIDHSATAGSPQAAPDTDTSS